MRLATCFWKCNYDIVRCTLQHKGVEGYKCPAGNDALSSRFFCWTRNFPSQIYEDYWDFRWISTFPTHYTVITTQIVILLGFRNMFHCGQVSDNGGTSRPSDPIPIHSTSSIITQTRHGSIHDPFIPVFNSVVLPLVKSVRSRFQGVKARNVVRLLFRAYSIKPKAKKNKSLALLVVNYLFIRSETRNSKILTLNHVKFISPGKVR
jgi:hypothetical protein